jgi:hypothetical protein
MSLNRVNAFMFNSWFNTMLPRLQHKGSGNPSVSKAR